jgi:hypothetical protein
VIAVRDDHGYAPEAPVRSGSRALGVFDGIFEPVEQGDAFVEVGESNVALVEHGATVVRLDQYAGHRFSFRQDSASVRGATDPFAREAWRAILGNSLAVAPNGPRKKQ